MENKLYQIILDDGGILYIASFSKKDLEMKKRYSFFPLKKDAEINVIYRVKDNGEKITFINKSEIYDDYQEIIKVVFTHGVLE